MAVAPLTRTSPYAVHGVDAEGNVVLRRQLKRRYVLAFFQKLPSCPVGIEACASSRERASERSFFCPTSAQFTTDDERTPTIARIFANAISRGMYGRLPDLSGVKRTRMRSTAVALQH